MFAFLLLSWINLNLLLLLFHTRTNFWGARRSDHWLTIPHQSDAILTILKKMDNEWATDCSIYNELKEL